MTIKLKLQTRKFVEDQVKVGRSGSAEEVVEDPRHYKISP